MYKNKCVCVCVIKCVKHSYRFRYSSIKLLFHYCKNFSRICENKVANNNGPDMFKTLSPVKLLIHNVILERSLLENSS